MKVGKSLIELATSGELFSNIFYSWWRIFQAFVIAAIVAIPLGVCMAAYSGVRAVIEPITTPFRSLPITAFFPLFLGILGMGELMKVGFLWFGMFFYLLATVIEEVNKVPEVFVETAYTVGASRWQVLWLLFRGSLPGIFASFIILYDIGWTYVILAETVNARRGVGYMIDVARKVLDFDQVFALIILIGTAALSFRWVLAWVGTKIFPQTAGRK